MAARFWMKRLWRRASLMQRLAFVALAPTLVTALLLAAILTHSQLVALRNTGHSTAAAVATQAAAITVDPLRSMQRRELLRIAQSIADLPNVARVQIRAADGEILADKHSRGSTKPKDTLTVTREVVELDPARRLVPLGEVVIDVSVAEAVAAQRASLRIALATLVASLLIATVIAWQAARWISAPLRQLAHAVHELGRGDRPVAVRVTDKTEIGELQHGFNNAAAALYAMHRDMSNEIEQATLELERRNSALQVASVAKARFIAAASHDLRQPLYALTLFSSALAVDEHDPVRLDRIAHIQECVAALDHLFSELLDLSRLETGAMQVEISEFPLDPMFAEVSRNFRVIAEQKDLRLVLRATNLWVRSDRTMVARILNNLVSNALRYTHRGGVLVGARQRLDGTVRIDVWDTGSGIAPEHLEHVFDEFYRIDTMGGAVDAEGLHRGLGLGLATVQGLAELLGTSVQLKSRPGHGSLFSFRMPGASARHIHAQAAAEPPLDVSGMRVLVIDDEPAILSGIRYLLRSWGCEVATAEDRAQALEAAEAWPVQPDIVISDLRLRDGESGLDALAALDRYYQHDGLPPFPRLLITGETRSERLREIKAAKIPVLYKPVSPEQLREAMVAVWSTVRNAA